MPDITILPARKADAAAITALDREAKRVLALFGKTPKKVVPSVGNEQEYFLIKKEDYARRKDLVITGRTLFGKRRARVRSLRSIISARFAPRFPLS